MFELVLSLQTPPGVVDRVARIAAGLPVVVASSAELGSWTMLVLGGTLAVFLSTSYRKPDGAARWIYLILLPALWFLGTALRQGFLVRQAQIAFVLREPTSATADQALVAINGAFANQIASFQFAIGCLGIWLLLYMLWWMFFARDESVNEGRTGGARP